MNLIEENLQKYQLVQDNNIYILSTSLIGINLKLACSRNEINNNANYSSIFTIDQLKKADQIFQIANDCEDVQWIFEEVILAKSVGILENTGYLDVYFYMRVSGRKAKVILRLNRIHMPNMTMPNNYPININTNMNNINTKINTNVSNNRIYNQNPQINSSITQNLNPRITSSLNSSINPIIPSNMNNMSNYQKNQERLSKLQNDANELIKEQNALRKQLSMFFGETDDVQENHERSRSSNQNNKYYNQLNNNNNYQNINNNENNMANIKQIQVNDEEDNDIYEVPPMNDNEQ
jgi:hypothetical protein